LTVARHVAELHGGTLEAFSAGVGAGAEFVLTLPLVEVGVEPAEAGALAGDAAAAASRSSRSSPSSPSSSPSRRAEARALAGLRILFVDDDADARDLMATVLEDAGGNVVIAASAAEAAAAFAAGTFDVIVSDVGMPDEDGLTLMRRIRAAHAGRDGALVTVAVSGYGSAEDLAASRAAGFDAHVVKPCEPPTLVALLARLARPTA
jgi:CheY-like chemotaxis protein